MRTWRYIDSKGEVVRIAHRTDDGTAWDHPPGTLTKRYKLGGTKPCPVCTKGTVKHPLDPEADRLRAEGAPAQRFEELRKQGWVEPSSRR